MTIDKNEDRLPETHKERQEQTFDGTKIVTPLKSNVDGTALVILYRIKMFHFLQCRYTLINYVSFSLSLHFIFYGL